MIAVKLAVYRKLQVCHSVHFSIMSKRKMNRKALSSHGFFHQLMLIFCPYTNFQKRTDPRFADIELTLWKLRGKTSLPHQCISCYARNILLRTVIPWSIRSKSVGITVKRKSVIKDAVTSIHFSGAVSSSILVKRTSSSHGGNFKRETSHPSSFSMEENTDCFSKKRML